MEVDQQEAKVGTVSDTAPKKTQHCISRKMSQPPASKMMSLGTRCSHVTQIRATLFVASLWFDV